MTKLITEGLVEKKSRAPVLYRITHDGASATVMIYRHHLRFEQGGRSLVERVGTRNQS